MPGAAGANPNATPGANANAPTLPAEREANFALHFEYGVCYTHVLDTEAGTYERCVQGEPHGEVPLVLSETELDTIYTKLLAIDFLSYPARFTVPVPTDGVVVEVMPSTKYRLAIQSRGMRHTLVQSSARANACRPPDSLVPGSYQADPVHVAGDYVVVVYSAQCTQPGGPPEQVDGYQAWTSGTGCGGKSGGPLTAPRATSGPTRVEVHSMGSCGRGPGTETLIVAHGRVAGSSASAAVTSEVQFADGDQASAPVQNGRLSVLALTASSPCQVRVLDAAGCVLAEDRINLSVPGSCP